MVLLVVVVPALLMAFVLAMEIVEDKLVGRGLARRTGRPGKRDRQREVERSDSREAGQQAVGQNAESGRAMNEPAFSRGSSSELGR